MNTLYISAGIILAVLALWCLLLHPRRDHPGWGPLTGIRYAHRGLHDLAKGVPENSPSAFRAAAEKGLGAELDVHLMADGRLAVVHDSSLQRVCGAEVCVEDLTAEELSRYPLLGSGETIPLLEEVLEIFAGRAPLIVELKVERGNAAALTDAAVAALEKWEGHYCVESFHPMAVLHLKRRYPHVIRGQLSQNFFKGSQAGTLSPPVAFLMTFLLTTFATRPDFIAYCHTDRNNVSLRLMKALYRVREVSWTVRSREELSALEAEGCIPIFEGFLP